MYLSGPASPWLDPQSWGPAGARPRSQCLSQWVRICTSNLSFLYLQFVLCSTLFSKVWPKWSQKVLVYVESSVLQKIWLELQLNVFSKVPRPAVQTWQGDLSEGQNVQGGQNCALDFDNTIDKIFDKKFFLQVALPAEVTVSGWEMVGQDYDAPSLRLADLSVRLFVCVWFKLWQCSILYAMWCTLTQVA